MTIEFADPGYNWAFVWWPVGILLVFVGLMIALYPVMGDAVAPLAILPILVLVFGPVVGAMPYDTEVTNRTQIALISKGFSNVEVVNDRFTAATEDGKYFEGVLVDLRPESGYAYRVLELTETGD